MTGEKTGGGPRGRHRPFAEVWIQNFMEEG
jgi:hypothetical protein